MCADSARKDSFSRLGFHFPGNKPRNRVCNIAEDKLARLTDGGANGTFITAAVRFYNAAVDAEQGCAAVLRVVHAGFECFKSIFGEHCADACALAAFDFRLEHRHD